MATAQVVRFSFCDVMMAKLIRVNNLPISAPAPPPLHKTLSVFQLVYCYHCSMPAHTVLLLVC